MLIPIRLAPPKCLSSPPARSSFCGENGSVARRLSLFPLFDKGQAEFETETANGLEIEAYSIKLDS